MESLLQCRGTKDIAARLACFDRNADALDRALEEGTVGVVNRKVAQARRQRTFGLPSSAGTKAEPAPAIDVAALQEVQSTVQSVTPVTSQAGRWNLQLANGMVWQTVDPLPRLPKAGAATTIRQVRFGGYRLSVGGQSRSYLVKRVR